MVNIMDNRPIGVFDSGIGGLTVLSELRKVFKEEDFIYIADQKNCPYGTKTDEELISVISKVLNKLISMNVKAIVIACNTASLFINEFKKMTDIPIISVIEPTCEYAYNISKTKNIIVLGTNMTIKKGRYQLLLNDLNAVSYSVPCSEFVDYIENDNLTVDEFQEVVNSKLGNLKNKNIDTLIHGCTHFSLVEDFMRNVLGDISYVACGGPTSMKLKEVLVNSNLLGKSIGNISLYTTGNKEKLQSQLNKFEGFNQSIEEIEC